MWYIYKVNDTSYSYSKNKPNGLYFTIKRIPSVQNRAGYTPKFVADMVTEKAWWEYDPIPDYVPPTPEPTEMELLEARLVEQETLTDTLLGINLWE